MLPVGKAASSSVLGRAEAHRQEDTLATSHDCYVGSSDQHIPVLSQRHRLHERKRAGSAFRGACHSDTSPDAHHSQPPSFSTRRSALC